MRSLLSELVWLKLLLQLPRALHSRTHAEEEQLLQHAEIGIPLRIIDILFFGPHGRHHGRHFFLSYQYALCTHSTPLHSLTLKTQVSALPRLPVVGAEGERGLPAWAAAEAHVYSPSSSLRCQPDCRSLNAAFTGIAADPAVLTASALLTFAPTLFAVPSLGRMF